MSINLTNLRSLPIEEIVQQARDAGLDNAGNLRVCDLIFELTRTLTTNGRPLYGDGILEILSDGFGFLRSPVSEYAPGTDDIYVSPSQIRRFNLRTGDHIVGKARTPREGERYFALLQIQKVNGNSPEQEKSRFLFDTLTVRQPSNKFALTKSKLGSLLGRHFKLLYGQCGFLHVPSRMNATALAVDLCEDFSQDFLFLGLGVRAEDVMQLRTQSNAEAYISMFGDSAARHTQVAEMALLRAKRLVEQKRDIVLFVDSIDVLAKAARDLAEQQGRSGVDSIGVHQACSLLSSSRALQQGGSLTIVVVLRRAVSPIEHKLLEAINRQMRVEVALSAKLARNGIFPPVDFSRSLPYINGLPEDPVQALKQALSNSTSKPSG